MNQEHQARVDRVVQQVQAFYDKKVPFKVYRGATNATRIVQFEADKMLDISDFNHILEINETASLAIVEPNVAMDQLVDATLPYGLVPPVVMEFPGITVGGGIQGGAGESSSYLWGSFDKTVEWMDVILASGQPMRVSAQDHADLFYGMAGSYGSLGVITRVAVRLIPAKKYVALRYVPVHSVTEAVTAITSAQDDTPDFLDGIMFGKDSGVILAGNLTNEAARKPRTFTKARDQWFYLHAQQRAGQAEPAIDYVPLKDYLFRYDRGAFWTGAFVFEREKVPYNRFTRWLLDPLLHTRRMYAALQASGMSQQCVIQDLAMPTENTAAFMDFAGEKLGIYPLWLCPLKVDTQSPLLFSYQDSKAIINVGVWGLIGSDDGALAANKALDSELLRLKGKKWLYAQCFYDEPTFWRLYDAPKTYQKLRKKYKAENLPTVYDKVHVTKQYPVSVRHGVLMALLGKNGLHRS